MVEKLTSGNSSGGHSCSHLVSHGLRVFKCLLAYSKPAVMCILLSSGFRLAILHKGLIGGVLQRWLSFWKVLQSPQSTMAQDEAQMQTREADGSSLIY